MSCLLKLVNQWRNERKPEDCDFRDLFKEHLHKEPYFLRYSLDKNRPDLLMVYMTDYSDRNNEIVQECNGIILDKKDFSLVAYGMKRMKDVTPEFHAGKFKVDYENYQCEEGEDGAVLVVYNYADSWIVSTKRSIDANNVKWSSSRNFYQLFSDALGEDSMTVFQRDLHKDFTYSFILLHPENHLVIPHNKPEVLYISRRNIKTLEEHNMSSSIESDSLSWARKRSQLSKNEAQAKLRQRRGNKRGIILSKRNDSTNDYDRIFIDYKWFSEAKDLRKGMPTLHLSYLACGPDEKQKMRSYFGNQPIFNTIDDILKNLVQFTFQVYQDSYVRKQFKVSYNHPIHKTIRKLHYDYKTTGEPVRIHHVIRIVDTIPTYMLDSMLLYFYTYGFHAPVDAPISTDSSLDTSEENNRKNVQDKTLKVDEETRETKDKCLQQNVDDYQHVNENAESMENKDQLE